MPAYPNHQDLRPFYVQVADPGAVGAGVCWYNTSSGVLSVRNITDTGWDAVGAAPSGSAGGDLSGTYPNPSVVNDSHTHAHANVTSVSANQHHNEDHDHDGSPAQQLTQANTHQSPDTDSATSSLHHTIGASATQAAAGNHAHTVKTLIGGGVSGAVLLSSTTYAAPFGSAIGLTEAAERATVPYAATAKNLSVRISDAQSATGNLVLTLLKGGIATAITITIAAGAAAGRYQDTSNSVSIAAGDELSLQIVNNAVASSTTIEKWSLELDAST